MSKTKEHFLTYGSIVSLMLDHIPFDDTMIKLSYNPKTKKKDSLINPSQIVEGATKNKSLNYFLSKDFLFTKGALNINCFFYKFKSISDIELNYFNSLFIIFPASENESRRKIKSAIKALNKQMQAPNYQSNNVILLKDKINSDSSFPNQDSIYRQTKDIFDKFKKEIQTNHEQLVSIIEKNTTVNFGDCLQFLHIASGNFLMFKKNKDDDLQIYITLSPTMCKHTVFRIFPGFNYQSEKSINVFFNLGIRIACGDQVNYKEKYFANRKYDQYGNVREKPKAVQIENPIIKAKTSLNLTNALVKKRSSLYCGNIMNKAFGKRLPFNSEQIVGDDSSFNLWKLIKYSNNFIGDEQYVNSLDLLWIENCEMDVYITSLETTEQKYNKFIKSTAQVSKKTGHVSSNSQSILSVKKEGDHERIGSGVGGNNIEHTNKQPDDMEDYPINDNSIKKAVSKLDVGPKYLLDKKEGINAEIPLTFFYNKDKKPPRYYVASLLSSKNIEYKDPMGIFSIEIVNGKGLEQDFSIPFIGPIEYGSFCHLRNKLNNKLLCVKNNENPATKAQFGQLLTFVDYSEIQNGNIRSEDTIFILEAAFEQKKKEPQIEERKDKESNGNSNTNPNANANSDNESNNNESMGIEDKDAKQSKHIKRTDTIRIRSKLYYTYIAIRHVYNENKSFLLLTKNLSDLTIFKMSFVAEEDKYELQFFEQLNYSIDFLNLYFKEENQAEDNEEKIKVTYEKLQHIILVLKKKLSEYNSKKQNLNSTDEYHSVDFILNLKQFNIISRLVDLFIVMWFKEPNRKDLDEHLTIVAKNQTIFDLKSKFTEQLLKIMKMVYDIDPLFINSIDEKIYFFFIFQEKINCCTEFLICILHNNHSLLEKMFSIEEYVQDTKRKAYHQKTIERLKRVIQSLNDCSNIQAIILFFELINTMLICNEEPFVPFYNNFFTKLGLTIEENKEEVLDTKSNPILVLLNEKCFDDFIKLKEMNSADALIQKREQYLSTLISLNLLLMSNLSLHNDAYTRYIRNTFKIEKLVEYMKNKYFTNNIKYGLNRLINLVYLKSARTDLSSNHYLCRNLMEKRIADDDNVINSNGNTNNNHNVKGNVNPNINVCNSNGNVNVNGVGVNPGAQDPTTYEINIIYDYVVSKNFTKASLDTQLLLPFIDSCNYILLFKSCDQTQDNQIFTLVSCVVSILELLLEDNKVFSESDIANESESNTFKDLLSGDKIELSDKLHMLSDQYRKMYDHFKKKIIKVLTKYDKSKSTLKRPRKGIFISSIGNTNANLNSPDGSMKKMPNELIKHTSILARADRFLEEDNRTFTRINEKNELVIKIAKMFLEFLKHIQSGYLYRVEERLKMQKEAFKDKSIFLENINDDERHCNFLINSIILTYDNRSGESELQLDLLDYFALFYQEHKKIDLDRIEKRKSANELFNNIFFQCIRKFDSNDVRLASFEILYQINSQRLLLFENISNLVIFASEDEYMKYERVKKAFNAVVNCVYSLGGFKATKESFKRKLSELLESIYYNKDKWLVKFKEMTIYELDSLEDIEENLIIEDDNDRMMKSFIGKNDISDDRIHFIQQILYNLGFESLFIKFMETANKIIKGKTKELVASIQICLVGMFKLLKLFIYRNKKHQIIIEANIELILFPMTLQNALDKEVLVQISEFLLAFLTFYNLNYLTNIERFFSMITVLTKNFDWKGKKILIPYWVEILKIVIKSPIEEKFDSIIFFLNQIKEVLIYELYSENRTKTDIMSMHEIIKLIIGLKEMNLEDYANKVKLLLPCKEIVNKFFDFPKNKVVFSVINKIIEFLEENETLYKEELLTDKNNNGDMIKNVCDYCKEIKGYTFNDFVELCKASGQNLSDCIVFYGYSLKKLYEIFNSIIGNDSSNNVMENCNIMNQMSDAFNEQIKYKKEIIFKDLTEDEKELLTSKLPFFKLDNDKAKQQSNPGTMRFSQHIDAKDFNKQFVDYWNYLRNAINSSNQLKSFHSFVRTKVNEERETFVQLFVNFIELLSNNDKEKASKKQFTRICYNIFKQFIMNNPRTKEEVYFFYWIVIHLLEYRDPYREKGGINNEIISEQKLIKWTMKVIKKKNPKSVDYEMLLYLKYLSTYLDNVDNPTKLKLFDYMINSTEGGNFFSVLNVILQNFQSKLTKLANTNSAFHNQVTIIANLDPKLKLLKGEDYYINKYENYIDPYIQVVVLLNSLTEKILNEQNLMKDYLRFQCNGIQSVNFYTELSNILNFFSESIRAKISNPKQNDEKNIMVIDQSQSAFNQVDILSKYYCIVINIIETLTKCCNGPNYLNQNYLVSDSRTIDFIYLILDCVSYRESSLSSGFPCIRLNLSRKRLAFLKYKLEILLFALITGRKKGDKIYDKINKENRCVVDLLLNVLNESFNELLFEYLCLNPKKLIIQDSNFLRFHNFDYNCVEVIPTGGIQNEKFIIYEIGTFAFIITNVFYDNLSKLSRSVLSYSFINHSNRKEKKMKIPFITSFYSFFKSLYFSFIQLFFFVSKIQMYLNNYSNDFDLFITTATKDFSIQNKYQFFSDSTPSIEIAHNGHLISFYIQQYPLCRYLTHEMKKDFQTTLDRTNRKSKLECLFKNVDYYYYALQYTKRITEMFKQIAVTNLLFNQYLFYKDFSFILTIAINFIIISSYFRYEDSTSTYAYAFLYRNEYLTTTENVINTLTILQLIISLFILVNYFIKYWHKYLFIGKKENKNCCFKFVNSLYKMVTDYYFLYHLVYVVFALLGIALQNYLFFAFHLVEIIPRSKTLMYIIKSFWIPKKQLIVTLFLFYLFEYYFVIFIYLYFSDSLPTHDCFRFDDCLFTIFDQTFKNSNGIINYLKDDLLGDEILFFKLRFWLDNLFAIVQIILILQMVGGIIVDSFVSLRQSQETIDNDQYNVCFICGLKRNELNKMYGNEEGYNEHIKTYHYFWNYMFMIFSLMKKPDKDKTEIDQYIYMNYIENRWQVWIPNKTCISKIEFESMNNNDEEKENGGDN